MRRRYGKLKFRAFLPVWLGMMVMLYLLAGSVVLRRPLFSVFHILILGWLLLMILLPFCERFSIERDRIITKKGRREENIALPEELLLVLSRASIPVRIRGRGYFLKQSLSLSLLESMEPGEFLERLHGKRRIRYTNETLEEQFRCHWIYSFVLDMEALRELTAGRKCRMIVPESLRGSLDLKGLDAEIFIDKAY